LTFIITLNQKKIARRQLELGWDIFELAGTAKLSETECEALFIKKDASDIDSWEFKPFGKDDPYEFPELKLIIKTLNKIADSLKVDYDDLVKITSNGNRR